MGPMATEGGALEGGGWPWFLVMGAPWQTQSSHRKLRYCACFRRDVHSCGARPPPMRAPKTQQETGAFPNHPSLRRSKRLLTDPPPITLPIDHG